MHEAEYNPSYWNEPYIDDHAPSEPCGANWDVRGGKGMMVTRAMVEMMRGGRPSPLNPKIYAAA